MANDRTHHQKVSPWSTEFDDPSLLRDSDGNKYALSTEDYDRMLGQREAAHGREIELQIAKELLNSNLTRLTGKQREVMYYTLLGYQRKRIAKELNISVGSVDSHLKLAKKKLAKYIKGTRQILEEGLSNGSDNND